MCSRGALLRGIGQAVGVKNLPDVYKRYFGPQETNVLGAEIIGRARNLYQCDREYFLDNLAINSLSLKVFLYEKCSASQL
jgi:multisubunit Na+/H+ antiporter MnhG subunit